MRNRHTGTCQLWLRVAIRTGQIAYIGSTGQSDGSGCDNGHYPRLLVRRLLCDGHGAQCEQTEGLVIAISSGHGAGVGNDGAGCKSSSETDKGARMRMAVCG